MINTLFSLAMFTAAVSAGWGNGKNADAELDAEFAQWVPKNGKNYKTAAEYEERKGNWKKNKLAVDELNSNKASRASFAVNFMSDLSDAEYQQRLGAFTAKDEIEGRRMADWNLETHGRKLQSEINWVEAGKVHPMKDQGQCGSCVSFGVMAVAESLRAIKDNADVIRLSEQHGVDCAQRNAINVTRDYGNYGCQGGWTDRYYDFMITEGVINYDDYYLPYNAQDNMCGHDSDLVAFKPARQGQVTGTVQDVIDRLALGPTAIAVSAGNSAWRYYSSGIMDTNDGCPSGYYDLDHVVTLVGYGMETVTETIGGTTSTTCRRRTRAEKKQGCPGGSFRSGNNCCTSTTTEGQTVTTEKDYFLVQNQWGTGWGDQGFIKMAATGGNGVCGMNLENLYIELE